MAIFFIALSYRLLKIIKMGIFNLIQGWRVLTPMGVLPLLPLNALKQLFSIVVRSHRKLTDRNIPKSPESTVKRCKKLLTLTSWPLFVTSQI